MRTLRPYFADNRCRICDCTVGGTFMWRDYHKTQYAIEGTVLYLKVVYPEEAFTPPRHIEHDKSSYDRIIEYCDSTGSPKRFCSVSASILQDLLELYPNAAVRTSRDCSDYLYSMDDIAFLAGRRYAGQRNHINRFMREHPMWSFERITTDRIPAVKEFYKRLSAENVKDSEAYNEGNSKSLEALDFPDAYALDGGALYVKGEVVGASLGEIVDDTLFIHSEKADTKFHGSYPMLVNQFAKMLASEDVKYVNREEDDGDEGLRTSKLSYHPIELLAKYTVELT